MQTDPRSLYAALLMWLGCVILLTVFTAGFDNGDSLKYVSIAKHMLSQQHYILPCWHHHPYADKGPLIFWLFTLGWNVFGISHWWPQLLMYLSASAAMAVGYGLAKTLWPQDTYCRVIFPVILLAMPGWIASVTEIRTDILLLLFCFLGIYALIKGFQGKKIYWLVYTVSLTLGFLCKGPVILLYTTLPALFFPFLADKHATAKSSAIFNTARQLPSRSRYLAWYGWLSITTLAGIALTLLWIIPAAMLGGKAFTHAILYGQITGRADFHHYSHFYYLVRLPLLLIPWLFYLPLYYGWRDRLRSSQFTAGDRLCLLIIVLSMVIFSFFGQKRLHYILPDIPLFALLISRGISQFAGQLPAAMHTLPKRFYQLFAGNLLLLLALVLILWPWLHIALDPRTHLEMMYLLNIKFWLIPALVLTALFYYRCQPGNILWQLFLIMLPFTFMTVAMNTLNFVAATQLAR